VMGLKPLARLCCSVCVTRQLKPNRGFSVFLFFPLGFERNPILTLLVFVFFNFGRKFLSAIFFKMLVVGLEPLTLG
jgi:hypothetical protein